MARRTGFDGLRGRTPNAVSWTNRATFQTGHTTTRSRIPKEEREIGGPRDKITTIRDLNSDGTVDGQRA